MSSYKQLPFFSENLPNYFVIDKRTTLKREEKLHLFFNTIMRYSENEFKKIMNLKKKFDKDISKKEINNDLNTYKLALNQSIINQYISEDKDKGINNYQQDIQKIIVTLQQLMTFVVSNFNEEDIKNSIVTLMKTKNKKENLYWFFDINEILLILPYDFEIHIPLNIYSNKTSYYFDFYNVFVKYIDLFIKSTISYYFEYSKGKYNDFEKEIITFFIKIHIFYLYTFCTFFKNAKGYADISIIKPDVLSAYSKTHNKMINFIKINSSAFLNEDKIKSDLLYNINIPIGVSDLDCLPFMTTQESIPTMIDSDPSDEDEEKESIRKKNQDDQTKRFVKKYRKRVAPPQSAVLNAELRSEVGRTRMREELMNENPDLIGNVDEPLSTSDTGVFDPGMFDRKAHEINKTIQKKSPPQLPPNYEFATPPKNPDNKKKKMNPPDATLRGGKTKSKSKSKRKNKSNKKTKSK